MSRKIYKSVAELIGNTPLLEVTGLEKELKLEATVLVKLEYLNPTGSVKDRTAKNMIADAEERGLLKPGATIIEPTSGNTGIGLAAIAASRGYSLILTMPETMSVERRNILKAYGAKIVLTEGAKGMAGAIAKAEELAKEIPGSFLAGQFDNPANPKAHILSTGPEIWEDTEGEVDILVASVGTGGTITGTGEYLKSKNPKIQVIAVEPSDSPVLSGGKPGVDILVASVGTGGTITGTGEYLKSKNPKIQVIAVEPSDSPVLSGGKPGPHAIQGIGAGFVPKVLNTEVYDEVVAVESQSAFDTAKLFAHKEGILVGISAGAALYAALEAVLNTEVYDEVVAVESQSAFDTAKLFAHKEGILVGISAGAALYAALEAAKKAENKGKTIVVLLPDSGDRYYSTPLFQE